jgi:hypothetical protein
MNPGHIGSCGVQSVQGSSIPVGFCHRSFLTRNSIAFFLMLRPVSKNGLNHAASKMLLRAVVVKFIGQTVAVRYASSIHGLSTEAA